MSGLRYDDASKCAALSPRVCRVRVAGSTRAACESAEFPP
jgi:hypothetical protein